MLGNSRNEALGTLAAPVQITGCQLPCVNRAIAKVPSGECLGLMHETNRLLPGHNMACCHQGPVYGPPILQMD